MDGTDWTCQPDCAGVGTPGTATEPDAVDLDSVGTDFALLDSMFPRYRSGRCIATHGSGVTERDRGVWVNR
jgi:hypothetical protein